MIYITQYYAKIKMVNFFRVMKKMKDFNLTFKNLVFLKSFLFLAPPQHAEVPRVETEPVPQQ